MKDLFQSLYLQLKDAQGPTRTVVAAGVVLLLAILGGAMFHSMNPNMVHLYGNLDQRTFVKVTAALGSAGIRMETSSPPGPYTVWVAAPDRQAAMQAIHSSSALEEAPSGIEVNSGGAASVFLGESERALVSRKRMWQEVQRQLEAFDWVVKAACTSSPTGKRSFLNDEADTASVVLTVYGTLSPTREQRHNAGRTVSNGLGIPSENVVISDQRGNTIFDGSLDSGLEDNLAYEEQFNRAKTERAQHFLDSTFGPGLARVQVSAEFSYEVIEKLDEGVAPAKVLLSKESRESSTPIEDGIRPGGPVSTQAGSTGTTAAASKAVEPATTSETREEYSPARNYTYTKHDTPVLKRMTISLVLDESLASKLPDATEAVKGVVGYLPDRDSISAITQKIPGVERDQSGQPVESSPPENPEEPPSPLVLNLIDHGVEIIAALALVILLFKGLKKGNVSIEIKQPSNSVDQLPDDDIDMDELARRHVEELLEKDPERVGALLSRWALADEYYIRSSHD